MNTNSIVEKILNITSRTILSVDDQHLLFVWSRHLLENENIKNNFPIVLLYCNWALHIEIDRDPECGPIISNITDALYCIDQQKSTTLFTLDLYKALLLKQLIVEFEQLFKIYSLPLAMFDKSNRGQFLNQLITNILIEKPLILNPNKKSQVHFDGISNKTANLPILALSSICFQFFPDYGAPDNSGFSTYAVVCTNRNDVSICVPIEFDLWDNIF